ncbi:hypothetical protein CVU37_00860 [candidate division BRC1 bacterium HGW-BRC1-1]|nr:MAG: hypothetical protein CVU37_00860 [candidate division BRC1 bacterium HGW-BRC1-1]
MAPMIRVLSDNLVNKIAAGEVIVRPASVVKELVENSVDAGATRVEIEVGNECRDLRVRDDGRGIGRADAELALVRHATSKISEFDDLWALETRGFRGEALASISAVSRMQILTRCNGELAGTLIECEGGGGVVVGASGAPVGTEVRVRDLFFNTPARLKFMKRASSELQQIMSVVTRQALMLPAVGFVVTRGKDTLLDVPSRQEWADRVGMLLGTGVRENLLAVDEERHGVRVTGFAVRPAVSRKDRRHQYFFVNGRPVSSRSLSFAVQEAYKGVIMVQRFPMVVINMKVPSGEVDVNVHPTKEEVRFRNEGSVNGAVYRAVQSALRAANLMPTMDLGAGDASGEIPQETGGSAGRSGSWIKGVPTQDDFVGMLGPVMGGPKDSTIPVDLSRFSGAAQTAHWEREVSAITQADDELTAVERHELESGNAATAPEGWKSETPEPSSEPGRRRPCDVRPLASSVAGLVDRPAEDGATLASHPLLKLGRLPEPLGQVALCYIIAQAGGDLLLIDQHAAHERLLYLKFAAQRGETREQPLLMPISVDVAASAVPFLLRLLPVLTELGLRVEHFGGQTFVIQSVPADLPKMDPAAVMTDMLDDFETLGRVEEVAVLRDRVVTRMACRAAIKAGQRLHMEEMRALIRDIVTARLGFTCPHGRPTMILLTLDQLDRYFKRKL